ncbi:hypothetical protein [Nostoc sp.]|uniref:hypothetical protein n=1 Tax=Nostoc sp. TaxID=1180 RepID=UPI002FF48808
MPRLQTHEQKRKLRTSEAGCGESRTPRFNREVPRIIPGIDSTQAGIRPVIAVEFDPTKPDLS